MNKKYLTYLSQARIALACNFCWIVRATVLVSLLTLFLTGCGLFKKQPSTPPPPPEEPKVEKPPTPPPPPPKPPKTQDTADIWYPVRKEAKYDIAVFLPFYLQRDANSARAQSYRNIATSFYRGMKIAADTARLCGRKLNIHVFDSENPNFTRKRIEDTLTALGIDLIIGPLIESRMAYIDSVAEYLRINRVSPVQSNDTCPKRNYYFESTPNAATMTQPAAKMARDSMTISGYKVYVVNEKDMKDNAYGEAFRKQVGSDTIKVINFNGTSAVKFKPDWKLGKRNIIFVNSREENFLDNIIQQFQPFTSLYDEETGESLPAPVEKIIIIGLQPWLNFKNIDGSLWEKYNIHLISWYNVDYEREDVKDFVRNYRKEFLAEPDMWSFVGFDELMYYSWQLDRSGSYFQRQMESQPQSTMLLSKSYCHSRTEGCQTWRNTCSFLLRFHDYRLAPVSGEEQ